MLHDRHDRYWCHRINFDYPCNAMNFGENWCWIEVGGGRCCNGIMMEGGQHLSVDRQSFVCHSNADNGRCWETRKNICRNVLASVCCCCIDSQRWKNKKKSNDDDNNDGKIQRRKSSVAEMLNCCLFLKTVCAGKELDNDLAACHMPCHIIARLVDPW